MKFISTRGESPAVNFEEAILTGLASDGGLFIPESLPQFDQTTISGWVNLSYQELAFNIFKPFIDGEIEDKQLKQIIAKSYSTFRHPAIAPLVQTDHKEWVLELFHGPTLAFKDFALQFLGNLLDYFLSKRNQKVVVLGATSGDTGSAAIEGCRHCKNIDIFILHPHNRVSDVQRRQMTTVLDDNVHNIAIDGNFDDCQNIVKASFRDQSFLPNDKQLVAVNSINWARIMAQIVYYFYAAIAVGAPQKALSFSVPTGNFGDIFAGYLAKKMGLPINKLIIATNQNDILHRCISNNDLTIKPLQHTLSPSMDIMMSSNFERLLFDLHQRDGLKVKTLMNDFNGGSMQLDEDVLITAKQAFASYSLDDNETLKSINNINQYNGYLIDPHSAIAVAAARLFKKENDETIICLATAHPLKFPEAMEKAGVSMNIDLPPHVADLFDREERFIVLENQQEAVHTHIIQTLRRH